MLPPSPASSFVPTCEREELMASYAAAVYAGEERGPRPFATARAGEPQPGDAAARAEEETAWLLETVETATSQAFSRMAEIFLGSADDCPTAAHHALATLLADLAGAPEMVHLAVVELPRLGAVAHEQQQRLLDLFCEFLAPGFAATGHATPDPDIVSSCLGGGIWETVRRLSVERRLHTLPELLPAISFVCISSFFGTEEAMRVSRIPVHVVPRGSAIG